MANEEKRALKSVIHLFFKQMIHVLKLSKTLHCLVRNFSLQYSHLQLDKRLWAAGLKVWLLEHLDSHLKSTQCIT